MTPRPRIERHLEVRRTLFQPFVTTKEGGTGLGLAVCHRIVAGYGGTIDAHGRPGGGTVFTILLPAENRARPPAGLRDSPASGEKFSPADLAAAFSVPPQDRDGARERRDASRCASTTSPISSTQPG